MSQYFERVDERFLPQPVRAVFPIDIVTSAEQELTERALNDPSGCYGYFPDVISSNRDLPACSAFAEYLPSLGVDGLVLGFSFLRLALRPQLALNGLHLDDNAASGICVSGVPFEGEAWRILFNLSEHNQRRMWYSEQRHDTVRLRLGYPQIHPSTLRLEVMPPRVGSLASGVLFCASRVYHGGDDGNVGHFVVSYGAQIQD